jgi:hypothetical protein
LALFGVTRMQSAPSAAPRVSKSLIVRTALAIGCANCVKLFIQYFVSMYFYRFEFALWYVFSAAVVTGLLYGGIGAAVGSAWGMQLRRTAP